MKSIKITCLAIHVVVPEPVKFLLNWTHLEGKFEGLSIS